MSNPKIDLGALRALAAALLLLPGAVRAAAPERAPEADEEEEATLESLGIEREGSPLQHKRYLDLLYGPAPSEALVRAQQAISKERDRVGPPSPSLDQVRRLKAVSGNAWISVGPTGSSRDTPPISAGHLTTQSALVTSIVPHPTNPDILYVTSEGGGVWKTYDATATVPHWEPITDSLGNTFSGVLEMDPYSPEILYLGMGYYNRRSPGLTYTRDGGATWADFAYLTTTVAGATATALWTHDLKVDPNNSSNVLAGTDLGLFRSTDAGKTWTHVTLVRASGTAGQYMDEIWSIAWVGGTSWLVSGTLPARNETGGIATYPGELGLWRSDDSGATWTWGPSAVPGLLTSVGRGTLATARSTLGDPASARVFLLASGNDTATDHQVDLFRSDDGGKHFVPLGVNASGAPVNPVQPSGVNPAGGFAQITLDFVKDQGFYNHLLVVHPKNPDIVYIGGSLAHGRSTDGGATWAVMSHGYPIVNPGVSYVHPDFHAAAISVAGTPTLWLGTDGGLSRSTDTFTAPPGKATYDDGVNAGMVTILPYSLACAPEAWPAAAQGYMLTGLQDNGTRMRIGDTTLFDAVNGGDGVGVAVSRGFTTQASGAVVPRMQLGGNFNNIVRSDDGGSFSKFIDGLGGQAPADLVPFAVDLAATDDRVFLTATNAIQGSPAGDQSIYRSVGGAPWVKIVGSVTAADGTTRNTLAATGTNNLGLRRITAYPKKAGVYAVNSNRFTWVTSDGGAHWFNGNFVGSDPNLAPDGLVSTSGIDFDPSDTTFGTLIATSASFVLPDGKTPVPDATGHVFKSTDKGVTWAPLAGVAGSRLPNVPATALQVDYNDSTGKTIYVGTNAGLYRTVDGGQHWARFGTGLPLAAVTAMCLNESSSSLKVAIWGRGYWQINTTASGNPAGVRGKGDMNHHLRLDGFDLIDLAATLGTTQADDNYRAEADLTGPVNAIGDDDLTAFLARFGGTP